MNTEQIEKEIINAIKKNGWDDGVCKIMDIGLNNVVNINGCTDILLAYVGTDGMLSFNVHNNDDTKEIFPLSLFDFPLNVIEKIYNKVCNN